MTDDQALELLEGLQSGDIIDEDEMEAIAVAIDALAYRADRGSE